MWTDPTAAHYAKVILLNVRKNCSVVPGADDNLVIDSSHYCVYWLTDNDLILSNFYIQHWIDLAVNTLEILFSVIMNADAVYSL